MWKQLYIQNKNKLQNNTLFSELSPISKKKQKKPSQPKHIHKITNIYIYIFLHTHGVKNKKKKKHQTPPTKNNSPHHTPNISQQPPRDGSEILN